MDGLPNRAAATIILLMLAAVAVVLLSTATALLDFLVRGRATRIAHTMALALVAVIYGILAVLDPQTIVGLLLGQSLGQIREDFPLLRLTPVVPLLVLLSCVEPFVRRFLQSRQSPARRP